MDHSKIGITKQKYFELCEKFGDPIDWTKCPPDLEDFPDYVIVALNIFNALPDRMVSTMERTLYIGKELSALPFLLDLYEVKDQYDKTLVFEVIQFLDGRAREQAIKAASKK